jgi:hypothetical protein
LTIAQVSVQQSNPELAEKLGWAALAASLAVLAYAGVRKLGSLASKIKTESLTELRALRNKLKHRWTQDFQSGNNADLVFAGRPSKIPVPVPKPIRNLVNTSSAATPPSSVPGTPTRTSALRRRMTTMTTTDFGKFELIHPAGKNNSTVYLSAHGSNFILGGKTKLPPGSIARTYAPATGTVGGYMISTKTAGFLPKEWSAAETMVSGAVQPTKTIPGGHYMANFSLTHFEHNSEPYLREIAKTYTVDVIRIKPGETVSSAQIFQGLKDANINYQLYELGHCRASEMKDFLNLGIPNRPLPKPSNPIT